MIALDEAKPLGEEEMKVHVTDDGLLDADQQGARPGDRRTASTSALTLIEPHAAEPLADALRGDLAARPAALLRGRLPGARRPRRARRRSRRSASVEWVEVDDHADLARAREVACRC